MDRVIGDFLDVSVPAPAHAGAGFWAPGASRRRLRRMLARDSGRQALLGAGSGACWRGILGAKRFEHFDDIQTVFMFAVLGSIFITGPVAWP